mmetsp:Transcript_2855/g.3874  ORF Transcript_2855/g.3874 Transcript_2855/m.3874 type:complete len:83 (+) Transcript_2855:76-324(+)
MGKAEDLQIVNARSGEKNLLQLKDPIDQYLTMEPSTFMDYPLEIGLAIIFQSHMTMEEGYDLNKRVLKRLLKRLLNQSFEHP